MTTFKSLGFLLIVLVNLVILKKIFQEGNIFESLVNLRRTRKKPLHREKIKYEFKSAGLNVAFAGFEQCGVKILARATNKVPRVYFPEKEQGKIMNYKDSLPSSQDLNATIDLNTNLVHAMLSTEMLYSPRSLWNFTQTYPDADVVVTVRHPLLHFVSEYTKAYKNRGKNELPDLMSHVGVCVDYDTKVPFCSQNSYFHHFISKLGLTALSSEEEHSLLNQQMNAFSRPNWNGRLFLVQYEQMMDKNEHRRNALERLYEEFLGLDANSFNLTFTHPEEQDLFDICDTENIQFRYYMGKIGENIAAWFTNFLLKSDRVIVPNKEHFLELLQGWKGDPCVQTMHQIKENFTPPLLHKTLEAVKDTYTMHHVSTNSSIRSDSALIDFAIGGFAKCGTTSMMQLANMVPQIYMGDINEDLKEVHNLRHSDELLAFTARYKHRRHFYNENGLRLLNGFKSPEILYSQAFLQNMMAMYPNISLFIQVRHPILHFQSQYNYKMRLLNETELKDLPRTVDMIGTCHHDCHSNCLRFHSKHVCTGNTNFHQGLSRLHLTQLKSEDEINLLDGHNMSIHSEWKGKLFLSEIGQMGDKNTTRKALWEKEFEQFLGIEMNTFNSSQKVSKNGKHPNFIHICDDQHKPVRDELLRNGIQASTWITEYLLKSERLVVANREHFLELLGKWKFDPCNREEN